MSVGNVLLKRADEAIARAVWPNVAATGHHVLASAFPAQMPLPRRHPELEPLFEREFPSEPSIGRAPSLLLEALESRCAITISNRHEWAPEASTTADIDWARAKVRNLLRCLQECGELGLWF